MFREVIVDMVKKGEVDVTSRYESLNKNNIVGDFKFVLSEKLTDITVSHKKFRRKLFFQKMRSFFFFNFNGNLAIMNGVKNRNEQ